MSKMPPIPLPSQEVLRELLDYNQETGILTWKPSSGTGRMNSFVGRPALNSYSNGYRHGCINRTHYRAHRVIWKWMTGEDPAEVDHINGIRDDNRWSNLRSVSHEMNCRNAQKRTDGASGYAGVYWDKRRGKWLAQARIDKKTRFVGYFDCKRSASEARIAAMLGQGFTERHIGGGGVPFHS